MLASCTQKTKAEKSEGRLGGCCLKRTRRGKGRPRSSIKNTQASVCPLTGLELLGFQSLEFCSLAFCLHSCSALPTLKTNALSNPADNYQHPAHTAFFMTTCQGLVLNHAYKHIRGSSVFFWHNSLLGSLRCLIYK